MARASFWCVSLRGKEGEKRIGCLSRLRAKKRKATTLQRTCLKSVHKQCEVCTWGWDALVAAELRPLPCRGRSCSWLRLSGGSLSPRWRASHTSAWAPPRCPPPGGGVDVWDVLLLHHFWSRYSLQQQSLFFSRDTHTQMFPKSHGQNPSGSWPKYGECEGESVWNQRHSTWGPGVDIPTTSAASRFVSQQQWHK